MTAYLVINHTADHFQLALFIDNKRSDMIAEDKRHTSKFFIPLLDELLEKNNMVLSDLAFCVINAGPGSFSTLRSLIASVNGLHLAVGLPLIAVDGLQATFLQWYNAAYEHTIVAINAFNNESYYLIAHGTTIVSMGYKKTELLHHQIAEEYSPEMVQYIDNKECSIEMIAALGYEKYQEGNDGMHYLAPLHLKKHTLET
jgi:tRNA A37 threonylcarbamoyladenosine modification protein TsaB